MKSLHHGDLQEPTVRPPPTHSILLVDDEPLIRELCAHALRDYRVLQAANGRQALELLDRETVDVVLADVMMPEMNGLDMLRAVKERTPNLPVIIMTGYGDKDVVLRALKAGANDFLIKPVNLLQLQTTVEKVLERQALREELIELKGMDRIKTDFLGLISHKLKTPTTAISLFIQNLAAGIVDPGAPGFSEALTLVKAEADYLDVLIKDLLYYSEFILQQAGVIPERLNLGELLPAILAQLAAEIDQRQLTVHRELAAQLPELTADRKQISFVLRALLENAIKFTPPGGQVTIAASATADGVRLSVTDSGTGIAADELPKIFEKFYQVDPGHTGQVRGFGLGLYYARQFVHSHGGSLRLDSTPGVGTAATIFLPQR